MSRSDWYVDKIEIELASWGENKGKYEGKIRFQNSSTYEHFSFKIQPNHADKFFELIKHDLVKTADKLVSDLIDNLQLRETVEQKSPSASPYVITPKKTIIEKAIDLAESAGLVTKKEPL